MAEAETSGPEATVVFGSVLGLHATRDAVERTLGIQLELHDSLYMGGDYYRLPPGSGPEVTVRPNKDLLDDAPDIPSWGGPTFIEVHAADPVAVADRLRAAGFQAIRR